MAPVLGPNSNAITSIPYAGPYLVEAWTSGCTISNDNGNLTEEDVEYLEQICRQNNGVYRVSACTWLFFMLLAIAAKCKPAFNR